MSKECLWYNGISGNYEVLKFKPSDFKQRGSLLMKAKDILYKRYLFTEEEWNKAKETLYLLDVDNLEKVV